MDRLNNDESPLRQWRLAMEMKQTELAAVCGISTKVYIEVETGQRKLSGKLRSALSDRKPELLPRMDAFWQMRLAALQSRASGVSA